MDNLIHKTVLVAGAGIAGLACSSRLIDAGFKVILLEANHLYGGRIRPLNSIECYHIEDFLDVCMEAGG